MCIFVCTRKVGERRIINVILSFTFQVGGIGVKAQLLDIGNLTVMDTNGTTISNSSNDSSPTDTLIPGQFLCRKQNQKLISWQKDGSPATNNGTYSFGWENNILCLLDHAEDLPQLERRILHPRSRCTRCALHLRCGLRLLPRYSRPSLHQ